MNTQKILRRAGIFILLLVIPVCTVKYTKKIAESENTFRKGDFAGAAKNIRPLVEKASDKDKLLVLLEAGIVYHTMGNFTTSNQIFENAWQISQTRKTELSKKAAAFLLNDTSDNFYGESFERILIPFYIALNYASLGNNESAFRWLRKMDYEMKDMKFNDPKYQQNILARYLMSVMAEHLGDFNASRVQYNNIKMLLSGLEDFRQDRYVLAVKENDSRDMNEFRPEDKKFAYNHLMETQTYKPEETGELVIIHQAGMAPVKQSRGKLMSDAVFMATLRISIEVALNARGAAMSTAAVLGMLGTAENPIPVYKKMDETLGPLYGKIQDRQEFTFRPMYDYETTAIRNFNDHYDSYVRQNTASIATKIVIAAIAAHQLANAAEEKISNPGLAFLARLGAGAAAGGAVAASIKPDLRCWHLLPGKMHVQRFFLKEGNYKIHFNHPGSNAVISSYPQEILIHPGDLKVITVRSFSRKGD